MKLVFFLVTILLPQRNLAAGMLSDSTAVELVATYALTVAEPSGLCLDVHRNFLWTVSDHTNRVYKLTLTGQTCDSLSFVGNDLEGIAQDPRDGSLWVVEEQWREIVRLDTTGREIDRVQIVVKRKRPNRGLEGIAIAPASSHFYLLNERSPRRLLELNARLKIIRETKLDFAPDFSGLCVDSNGSLWILSDSGGRLFKTTRDGLLIASYVTHINKAEGIACAVGKEEFYIVSDSRSQLYRVRLPAVPGHLTR